MDRRGLRRGKDGRCRRERLTEAAGWPEGRDGPTGRPEREGACAGTKSEQARRWQQREWEHARPRRTLTPHYRLQGLTDPSSATAGEKATIKARRYPAVRWSALLGPRPRNLDAGRTDVDSGGGMTGAAAGKGRLEERTRPDERRAGGANGNRHAIGRTGTGVPSKNSTRETQGLTDSSSATEAGRTRLETQERRSASLCSLERVVRPAPTERTNVDRRGVGRGNDGPCRPEGMTEAGDRLERQTADTERAERGPTWAGEREPACRSPTENKGLRA